MRCFCSPARSSEDVCMVCLVKDVSLGVTSFEDALALVRPLIVSILRFYLLKLSAVVEVS